MFWPCLSIRVRALDLGKFCGKVITNRDSVFFLQVNRPLSMKKEGIQTRKRKPKNPGQGNQGSPAGPMSSVIKTDIKTGIQHGKLDSYRSICGLQIKT
jgi:hypothetical protein